PFAGEAPVKGVFHVLALPSVLDDLALEHFEQEASASASRVTLLTGRPIAGTHRSARRRPALPHSHATLGGARKPVADIAAKCKARSHRDRLVRGALPQILVSRIDIAFGAHELARIHAVVRVPRLFKRAKRRHELF